MLRRAPPVTGCAFPAPRSCLQLNRRPPPPSHPLVAQPLALDTPIECTPEPLERYQELLAKWANLPWRLMPKPGAAHTKVEDFYRLYAASQQVRRALPQALCPQLTCILALFRPSTVTFLPARARCGPTKAASITRARSATTRGQRLRCDFAVTIFLCVQNLSVSSRLKRVSLQGLSRDDAIAAFCRIYAEAHSPGRAKMNFF